MCSTFCDSGSTTYKTCHEILMSPPLTAKLTTARNNTCNYQPKTKSSHFVTCMVAFLVHGVHGVANRHISHQQHTNNSWGNRTIKSLFYQPSQLPSTIHLLLFSLTCLFYGFGFGMQEKVQL